MNNRLIPLSLLLALQVTPAASLFENSEQQAARFFSVGDYDKAARVFSDAYRRGVAAYRAGDYEQAAKAFEQVERPEVKADARYNLGNSRAHLDDLDGAARAYREALEIQPKHTDAEYNLQLVEIALTRQHFDEEKKQEEENRKKKNSLKKVSDEEKQGEKSEEQKQGEQAKEQQQGEQSGEQQQDEQSGEQQQGEQAGEHQQGQQAGEHQQGQQAGEQQQGEQAGEHQQGQQAGEQQQGQQAGEHQQGEQAGEHQDKGQSDQRNNKDGSEDKHKQPDNEDGQEQDDSPGRHPDERKNTKSSDGDTQKDQASEHGDKEKSEKKYAGEQPRKDAESFRKPPTDISGEADRKQGNQPDTSRQTGNKGDEKGNEEERNPLGQHAGNKPRPPMVRPKTLRLEEQPPADQGVTDFDQQADRQSDNQDSADAEQQQGGATGESVDQGKAPSLPIEQWLQQVEGNPTSLLRNQFIIEEQRMMQGIRQPLQEPRPW